MFTQVLNPSELIGVKDRDIGRKKMNNVLTLQQPSPLNPEPSAVESIDLRICRTLVIDSRFKPSLSFIGSHVLFHVNGGAGIQTPQFFARPACQ